MVSRSARENVVAIVFARLEVNAIAAELKVMMGAANADNPMVYSAPTIYGISS